MLMSWVDGGGIKSCFAAWVSRDSQVSSKSRAFLRSAIDSEIVLHLDGPFDPPKVSHSALRTYNAPLQFI